MESQSVVNLFLPVHKRCAWPVGNHVDERVIPGRTTAPRSLPNQ
jgi:hypothetical protein